MSPLVPSHSHRTQHRDFVQSAHLPQQQQQQQQAQQQSQYSSLVSNSLFDDDDDLSAAWNGHSTLSFDSVDDYDETDFQLAAQQLRATTAAKQLIASMSNGKAAHSHTRSVSVNSTATSTIVAPPGFHYHNQQQQQQSEAAAELVNHIDNLSLQHRDWESGTSRTQSLSQQQQPTSVHNHYQLYSGLSNSQPSPSYTQKQLHQQQHNGHSPSLSSSFPVPLHTQPVSGPANGCNLYVDQLPIPFSEHDLRTIFAPFGHIEKLRVAIDPLTGNTTHNTSHTFTSCDVIVCCAVMR